MISYFELLHEVNTEYGSNMSKVRVRNISSVCVELETPYMKGIYIW